VERFTDPHVLDWLSDRVPEGDDVASSDAGGFDATGWESSVWILHAMYETDEFPSDLTHDDVVRIYLAAGIKPMKLGELTDADSYRILRAAGIEPVPSAGPPDGADWRRLLWSDLASRLGVDPHATGVPPSHQSFPYGSWPATIEPPTEGSLDRAEFLRLVDHLTSVMLSGHDANCVAFYSEMSAFDAPVIYKGALKELVELDDDRGFTPSNVWPDDKSWFVYTDSDLWATKVSGSVDLINRLSADTELETVALRF